MHSASSADSHFKTSKRGSRAALFRFWIVESLQHAIQKPETPPGIHDVDAFGGVGGKGTNRIDRKA
jgi:hypothetical protein